MNNSRFLDALSFTGCATERMISSGVRRPGGAFHGRIKLESIREITTKLSSKEFEGRGTGQPGADKAAAYIADLFKKFGLKPAGDNGTFL